jgi:hypothetical protein
MGADAKSQHAGGFLLGAACDFLLLGLDSWVASRGQRLGGKPSRSLSMRVSTQQSPVGPDRHGRAAPPATADAGQPSRMWHRRRPALMNPGLTQGAYEGMERLLRNAVEEAVCPGGEDGFAHLGGGAGGVAEPSAGAHGSGAFGQQFDQPGLTGKPGCACSSRTLARTPPFHRRCRVHPGDGGRRRRAPPHRRSGDRGRANAPARQSPGTAATVKHPSPGARTLTA